MVTPLTVFSQADAFRKTANLILPFFAAGAVYANMICDTGCTYLYGALFGVDLHYLGFMLAAAILVFSLPLKNQGYRMIARHARACLLYMAVGGGAVLLHFQWVHEIFCPFCLAYGALIFILFMFNLNRTIPLAAAISFAAGLAVFALFFEGSAMPVFQF